MLLCCSRSGGNMSALGQVSAENCDSANGLAWNRCAQNSGIARRWTAYGHLEVRFKW